MEVEYSNTSSGWKCLDHLKFVFNNIGLDNLINNEINMNTFKRFFGSFVREREFDYVNKKFSLEFFKNIFIFQGKQQYLSNVVEFQSSRLKLSARTNTIALNTTLNRMKLRDSPICEACPYNSTEHFLLKCPAYKNIRDQSFQEIVDHMNVFMPFLDFTELSPLQKLQFLIVDTCYYHNQKCGDFFDRIGKTMVKRIYVLRSNVLNID
jgi:hypothetical protein